MRTRQSVPERRLSPQNQALAWHALDVLLALSGLLGHFWLRRQYARRERG